MRCPTCGTDNAPDSRFCGGCGNQLAAPAPAQRVAPTAKIPDDAPIAPPTRPQAIRSPNVSYAPPAMPGPAAAPAPAPVAPHDPDAVTLQRQARPSAVGTPSNAPRASNASISASFSAPAQSPLGLIAIVLVIDLALAGAGAFMLAKGLAKPPSAASSRPATSEPAPSASKPEQKSEATPPAPEPPAAAPEPPPPEPPPTETAATPSKDAPSKSTKPTSARRATKDAPTGPVSTEKEIAQKVMGSRIAFAQCRERTGEAHGNINIAFRVLGNGTIGNASVVENTTSNAELAECLRDTIATWKMTPHNGAPLSFMRPFSYP